MLGTLLPAGVVWFKVWVCLKWLPSVVWCSSRFRSPVFGIVIIIIIIIIMIPFLSWVNCHRNRACQERQPCASNFSYPHVGDCRSVGWKAFIVTRICVWGEILVTVDGVYVGEVHSHMDFGMF